MRAWLAASVLFVAYNLLLLSDHHWIRVSLVDIREIGDVAQLDRAPAELGVAMRFEPAAGLAGFRSPVEAPAPDAGTPTERALELFRRVSAWIGTTDPRNRCWNSESPQLIADNLTAAQCRGFCADYAILMAAIAQQAGFPARRVVMEAGDRLGGSTHVVTELWLADQGRWVMVDPSYFTMPRDLDGRYLSAQEVRRLLLGGQAGNVVIEPFADRGLALPVDKVKDYYVRRISDLQYPANSDIVADHEGSAARRAVSAAEQFTAQWGPSAMMLPRFAGRLLLTRTRYRVVDDLNPESYSPQAWFAAYRASLGVVILLTVLVLVVPLVRRVVGGKSRRGRAGSLTPPASILVAGQRDEDRR